MALKCDFKPDFIIAIYQMQLSFCSYLGADGAANIPEGRTFLRGPIRQTYTSTQNNSDNRSGSDYQNN